MRWFEYLVLYIATAACEWCNAAVIVLIAAIEMVEVIIKKIPCCMHENGKGNRKCIYAEWFFMGTRNSNTYEAAQQGDG